MLQAGRVLVEGPYDEVRDDPRVIDAYLGGESAAERAGPHASYGEAQVLRDVSLDVAAGEVVTLVGRNGAGKTTLLRCVMGLHRPTSGTITFDGTDITGLPAHRRARRGLGWVPDDRGIYATLSVEENLTLPPGVGDSAWSLDQVYEAFPVLKERRKFPGTKLSGGEQQMLAIARVLRMGARLLLCDEPTEGLSPLLVQQIGDILREVKAARRDGAAGRAEPPLRHRPSPTGTTCSPRAGSSRPWTTPR